MKLIAALSIALICLSASLAHLVVGLEQREETAFERSAREDQVVRGLILDQLERDRSHAEQQIAEARAEQAAETQFFMRYNEFASEVTIMMRGLVDHKADRKASVRVDKAWRRWRGDPGWPGAQPFK